MRDNEKGDKTLNELKDKVPEAVEACLAHFEGLDRSVEGFEGLSAAQNCINTDDKKDAYAKDFKYLAKLWEALSPDRVLDPFLKDYRWLAQMYESVRPPIDTIGKLLWMVHGPQTTKLIHENIHVGELDDLDEFILDADIIDDIFNNPDKKKVKRLEKILNRATSQAQRR